MKKLLGIFIVLSLNLSVMGQHSGVFGRITDQPEYELLGYMFDADDLNAFIDGKVNNNIDMLYSFVNDGKLYLLSYDVASTNYRTTAYGQTKERNLWLFSWDGKKWSKASTSPIQIDYKKRDNNGVQSHDMYYPLRDKGGLVEMRDNGYVFMRITRHTLDTYEAHIQPQSDFYEVEIVLTPENGSYKVK